MTIRVRLAVAATLAVLAVPGRGGGAEVEARRPNVVLILADDLGWGDVGYQGRTDWATPNIDRLARRGATLRRCHAAGTVCAPSRAALMTGKATIHSGVGRNDDDLPTTEVTLAEALRARGYATALFGKWHQGKARPGTPGPVHPLDHGFDASFGFVDAVHAWEKFPEALWDGRTRVPVSGYADDLFVDRAVGLIEAARDRPFFLYLPLISAHFNIEAPADEVAIHRGKFAEDDPANPLNATYAAMVTRLDRHVGRVVAALEARGIGRETLVVFASDHGATFEKGNLGTSRFHGSNRPLRGQKRTLYEGGLRIPAVVAWPGRISEGTVVDGPTSLLDVFPTVLAAAGGRPDPAWRVDGVDLLPTLTAPRSAPVALPDRTLSWEWRSEGSDSLAALHGADKLVVDRKSGRTELFDLDADPGESRDLSTSRPEVARSLRAGLDAWLATEVRR